MGEDQKKLEREGRRKDYYKAVNKEVPWFENGSKNPFRPVLNRAKWGLKIDLIAAIVFVIMVVIFMVAGVIYQYFYPM